MTTRPESFKKRMMRKFLLDATICALRGADRDAELPKPDISRVAVSECRLDFGRADSAIGRVEVAFQPLPAKGLFAKLKKPGAVVRRRRAGCHAEFNEDCLFSGASTRLRVGNASAGVMVADVSIRRSEQDRDDGETAVSVHAKGSVRRSTPQSPIQTGALTLDETVSLDLDVMSSAG